MEVGCSSILTEALGLGPRELISLVGAGGKTTLMYRLARELACRGKKVITTTTTRILEPSPEESPCLFVGSKYEEIGRFIDENLPSFGHITVAGGRIEPKKLKGISSELVGAIWEKKGIDCLINEADGAAGRPVKAPREGEPVIPSCTTLVVALLGVDGLGVELREEKVFRCERVSLITGVPAGGRMTDEAMAVLFTHPDGVFKGTPTSSRRGVFLNKVDISDGVDRARRIARRVLDKKDPRIERVILGQLQRDPPVVEVLEASKEKTQAEFLQPGY